MYKRVVLALCFAQVLLLNSAAETAPAKDTYTSPIAIVSRRAARDFVPDGNLDKPVWQGAGKISFDRDWTGGKHFPQLTLDEFRKDAQLRTDVLTLWTDKYVYFGFRCKYTVLNMYQGEDINKERWGLWDRDVVEVFLNPEPVNIHHYYEFEVAPNNQWIDLEINLDREPFNDAAWNSKFEHATVIDERNHIWNCEMRIPIRAVSQAPLRAGALWRINFYRANGLGDDSVRHFLNWSPVLGDKANFHTPSRFGTIRFLQ